MNRRYFIESDFYLSDYDEIATDYVFPVNPVVFYIEAVLCWIRQSRMFQSDAPSHQCRLH